MFKIVRIDSFEFHSIDRKNSKIKLSIILVGRKHGINGIQEPYFQESYESRQFSPPLKVLADIKRIFERILDKAKETNRPLNMIVAFFSNENDLAYKAIKTCADLSEHNFGIPTQCIMSKNVIACKDQVISNILLKINSKLCGTNFVLSQNNQKYLLYSSHFHCP
jgi:hypothetical protein